MMAVTVFVNGRTVVHKESDGKSIAYPDVCLTQVGTSVVPVPYANTALTKDMESGAKTVHADGQALGHEKSIIAKSTGAEASTHKGISSGTAQGIAEFVSCSFDVFVEGNGVVRAFDQLVHNNRNTPPTHLIQTPFPLEDNEQISLFQPSVDDEMSQQTDTLFDKTPSDSPGRSEERRVGKECRRLCRSRWSPYH
jgi:hypothetical protein